VKIGPLDPATSFAIPAIGLIGFVIVIYASWRTRRQPDAHKRLILLATAAILWPAWFRWRHFLPTIPRPDIWLGVVAADLPIAIAALRDRIRFGAVHPAFWTAGVALGIEQASEVMLFGTDGWHRVALSLLEILP
jgi:hypothetical protein